MTREDLEQREDILLAPWAAHSRASLGRAYPEAEHRLRTAFQRDRDRVIHSTAFRRLEYKTQVFVNHEGDYYRTRLTHTMEAAQITRTIARALRLNEDYAEAVVLAHDLGHTPFGHAGERVLDGLMRSFGGFEHNAQSLRIVEWLEERYPRFPGLNLSWEVREGIAKHSSDYDRPLVRAFDPTTAPPLEAQIADLADEIASNCHDIDDGIQSGMLDPAVLEELPLWREGMAQARADGAGASFSILRYQAVRRVIDALVLAVIGETERRLLEEGIQDLAGVRAVKPRLTGYGAGMESQVQTLKALLMQHLYTHVRVTRMGMKAKTVITALFETYLEEPRQMPAHVVRQIDAGEQTARVIADYIAGMTDRFAFDEYRKLFDPLERV